MLKGKFSSRRRVTEEVDAMSGLANLSDVMLVFACGLMAAVILNWNVDLSKTRVEILQREQMQELHKGLGLSVYSRSDFILDENGQAWCLEINTLPGMTPTSLVPQEAAQVGLNYGELCEKIVELSLAARKAARA